MSEPEIETEEQPSAAPEPAPPVKIADLLIRHGQLLRLEVRAELDEAARRGRLLFFGGLLFSIGFCFLQITIFTGLVQIGLPVWLASLLLGIIYIVGAGLLVIKRARRDPKLGEAFEASADEFQRSLEWISKRFF